MPYVASSKRYTEMEYRLCGRSGLRLPLISLGLWHNFGDNKSFDNCQAMLRHAFDLGITHFDLANNYGPPPGSAETKFGQILHRDFLPYRDEMIISSKAGFTMWDGPYGDWGSKKYLVASLNQSLKRMGLDYVDIFYHHRPDPDTPLEETMAALDLIVRQGKALYVGISNYPADLAKEAIGILTELGTPCLIHQPKYSMLERTPEEGLLDVLEEEGVGSIAYSPLAGGILTDRYLNGIPADSRAAGNPSLPPERLTSAILAKVKQLNEIAAKRDQKLSQMALAWLLRHDRITSVLIGASRISQIDDAIGILKNRDFSQEELKSIELILES
ncbi:aldo/keto reductase [Providencia vermicola]|uniref:aldo/keto reductase n=1 Tax=Providencia vermicola TaxID=333965 RepID=UPI001CED15E7|nr:aldo/keto reductase [Providencia vermicola]